MYFDEKCPQKIGGLWWGAVKDRGHCTYLN